MRMLKKLALLCLALCLLAGLTAQAGATPPAEASELTILFTHDTHDHWLPVANETGGEYGGYTRLATLIRRERDQASAPVVTLDAGDFSMGSLFQTIYSSDAPELRALGAMGYDATTFGNHEFDYRAEGLSRMLNAARTSGDPLPAIVAANYKPPESDTTSWHAWNGYGVTDYAVIERDGLRIAVFGLLGVDADDCAPMSGMEFEPIADAAKRVVADIQANADADFVICLSHSGTEGGKGEDYELAKEVDGIDVIISGHTHSITEEPIEVNHTLIVSCGPYTANLGRLTICKSERGHASVEDFTLIPVDETVAEDPAMTAMAENYKRLVDEKYLSGYRLTFDQVLAASTFDFTPISVFGDTQKEEPLGNLIADSYIYAVREAEGEDYIPVDFAVVASGVIRASLVRGNITTSDAFNVSSLGSGADGTPGYPLISCYITGKELKDAFEVDASVTPLMSAAQLYGAGMEWTFNPHRMIFNKVTDCAQVLEDGTRVPLEDDQLYRVVTGLYSGQMLGTVNGKSFGILGITPRDENGNPISDLERYIVHNKNGSEVKEWFALASYLQSMGTVDSRYGSAEGRKVVAPSWNPIQLLKSPNWITLAVLALALLLVVLVCFVVYRLATRKRRRTNRRYYRYRG